MSEYRPDTDSVRACYLSTHTAASGERVRDEAARSFDRWLAGIRADAFDEGAEAQMEADENGHDATDNPYEEAAWSTPMGADHER